MPRLPGATGAASGAVCRLKWCQGEVLLFRSARLRSAREGDARVTGGGEKQSPLDLKLLLLHFMDLDLKFAKENKAK